MTRRRVVITGMGAVTPLGRTVRELYESQLEGKSGVGYTSRFNAQTFPTRFAAEVRGFDLRDWIPAADCARWEHAGLNSQFAAAAAKDALADAGVLDTDRIDRTRFGVYLGTGEGVQDFNNMLSVIAQAFRSDIRDIDSVTFTRAGLEVFHGFKEAEQELHTTPAHLADYYDLQGPNFNCLTACAASSQAIGEATEMIRHGDADVMLSGGAHSMIHPFGLTGFNLLTALSTNNAEPTRASRPFDLKRD